MNKTLSLFVFSAISILLAVAFAYGFSDVIMSLGRNIPQTDLVSDYIAGAVWAVILGLSILAWPVPSSHKKALGWAWVAKCILTLGLMLFYEAHYADIDMYGLFYGSTNKWFQWENFKDGTLNMRQLCWLHAQIFPDSFHLMKVNCSFVGFVSVYLYFRAAAEFIRREDFRYFTAMFMSPSLIFFSSTLGKDPIVLLGTALYAYGVARWHRTGSWRYVALILLGAGETMLIRLWMGPILLAPLVIIALLRSRSLLQKMLVVAPAGALLFFSTGEFQAKFNIGSTSEMVTRVDDITHSDGWEGGSGRQSVRFTDASGMAGFVPLGAFTALFRPLPGEVNNVFGIVVGFENLAMLGLLWLAVRRTRLFELAEPVVSWAILLLLIWASFYGFASYQNMGAAVRYRLQIQPILLGLLLYLSRKRGAAADPIGAALAAPSYQHAKTAR